MNTSVVPQIPKYPQVTPRDLNIGQGLRYKAGNGVIRLEANIYLAYQSDGATAVTLTPNSLSNGRGDLLLPGTRVTITL